MATAKGKAMTSEQAELIISQNHIIIELLAAQMLGAGAQVIAKAQIDAARRLVTRQTPQKQ